jgi:hypothetical protein
MDTAVNVWNLLWDYQIHIVVLVVFLIWVVVRGSDVIRWVARKLRANGKKAVAERESGSQTGNPEK